MTLPGETVGTGADHPGTPLRVCWSAAGYYIGYLTVEGFPSSRESLNYWALEADAEAVLKSGDWAPRTTEWNPSPLTVTVVADWDSEPF